MHSPETHCATVLPPTPSSAFSCSGPRRPTVKYTAPHKAAGDSAKTDLNMFVRYLLMSSRFLVAVTSSNAAARCRYGQGAPGPHIASSTGR